MMQPIRMRTAIEMRLFTSGKASSSSPVLVLKVPTISQEREDNIETGIELILNYIVVMFNSSNECIHNTFKRQTKE